MGDVIDGERWIAERLRFLRERRSGELSESERRAVEEEIRLLSKERGVTVGGRRSLRFLHRLRRR